MHGVHEQIFTNRRRISELAIILIVESLETESRNEMVEEICAIGDIFSPDSSGSECRDSGGRCGTASFMSSYMPRNPALALRRPSFTNFRHCSTCYRVSQRRSMRLRERVSTRGSTYEWQCLRDTDITVFPKREFMREVDATRMAAR